MASDENAADLKNVALREVSNEFSTDSVTHVSSNGDSREGVTSLKDLPLSKKILLAALVPFVFCVFLSFRLMVAFYPHEAAIRSIDPLTVGWVFSSQSIFAIAPMLTVGALISNFGACQVALAVALISSIANISFGLISFVNSPLAFTILSFLLRGIQGIAISSFDPAIFVIVDQEFKPIYTTVIGITEGAVGVALLGAPVIGAVLYQRAGFLVPFMVIGVLMLLMIIIMFFVWRNQWKRGQLSSNLANQGQGLCQKFKSLCKFMLSVLRKPRLVAAAFGMLHVDMMKSSLDPVLEPYAHSQLGVDAERVGIWWLVSSAVYIVLVPLTGYLINRYKKRFDCLAILIVGHVLGCIGLLLIGPSPILPFLRPNEWLSMGGLMVLGLASALCFVPGAAVMMSTSERKGIAVDEQTATSSAAVLFFLAGRLSSMICPIMSGALEPVIGFPWTVTIFAGASLVMMLVSAIIMMCTVKPGEDDNQ